jgi:lipoprotein LprG
MNSRLTAPLLASLALVLAGCTGGDDGGGGDDSPEQVLADAKKALDSTKGVDLELDTTSLPKGVDGVLNASGVGTHAPAFQGKLKVVVNSLTVDVPVTAVQGEVFAKLPFTTKYVPIQPSDYGAPDPARLMDPQQGLSAWLTGTQDVKKGDQTRKGEQVLTTYSGTLPGKAVASVIPSADEKAEFSVRYSIDEDGRLDTADVKGPFYGADGVVDYEIAITEYGVEKDITAP